MWRSVGRPARTTAAWSLACLLCGAAQGADSVPRPLDRIEIERRNVFPDTGAAPLPWAFRALNRLHPRTRTWVIRHEIPFEPGDRPDSADLAEAERLLRRRRLFESVIVREEPAADQQGGRVVRVRTQDLWSTAVVVDYEKQADLSEFTLGLRESNLLGTGNVVHFNQVFSTDRDQFLFEVDVPRILRSRAGLSALYSEGGGGVARLLHLERSLELREDRFVYGVRATSVTGTRRFYARGDERGYSPYTREVFDFHAGWYSPGERRPGFGLGILKADTDPRGTPTSILANTPPPPPMDRIRFLGLLPFAEWMERRYRTGRERERYGATEDIAVGWVARVAGGPNLSRRKDEDHAFVADAHLQVAAPVASSWLSILDAVHAWSYAKDFAPGASLTQLTATLTWQPHPRLLSAAQGIASSGARRHPSRVAYLGGASGLRGFPSRRFEVRDYGLVTIEQRAWSGWEVLWAGIGANLFADAAYFAENGGTGERTWRSGWGAGLLLGLRKSSQKPLRIEVAWRTDRRSGPTFSVTTSSILQLVPDLDLGAPSSTILNSIL